MPPKDEISSPGGTCLEHDSLVSRLLNGEPEAVATVAGWARGVARHRAWGFTTPEDISQETLLALVRGLREGRFVGGDLRAYVRRIAKNISISGYRRARRRRTQLLPNDDVPEPGDVGSAERLEHRTMARRILAGLDEACRQLILLAYYQGYSRREIAEQLGVSEGATKVRLFRCIERARAIQAGG